MPTMPMEWNVEVVSARLAHVEDRLHLHQSRAAECRRILAHSAAPLKSGTLEQAEEIQAFALALQDGLLIIEAFESLMTPIELPGAADRLRAALGGGSVMVPNHDPDPERDALWELSLAGIFRRNGIAPQFGDDVMPGTKQEQLKRPDIFVTTNGLVLGVEAKRSRSRQRMGQRVVAAVKQIASACAHGRAKAGFLALDLSFATEQHAQHALWAVSDSGAKLLVREAIARDLVTLQKEIYDIVQAEPGGEHIVGTVTMVMPVLRVADRRQLGLVRYFTRAPYLSGRPAEAVASFNEVTVQCFSDAR